MVPESLVSGFPQRLMRGAGVVSSQIGLQRGLQMVCELGLSCSQGGHAQVELEFRDSGIFCDRSSRTGATARYPDEVR